MPDIMFKIDCMYCKELTCTLMHIVIRELFIYNYKSKKSFLFSENYDYNN